MSDIETLNQMNFARSYTFGRLKQSNDKEWDTQPEGYNNTIRWNVGHIFVTMETFTHLAIPEYAAVRSEWIPLFSTGTSPADWKGKKKIPSNDDLLMTLKDQKERLTRIYSGNIELTIKEPIKIGPLTLDTVEAVVQFLTWHEGIHAGMIDGLNKAIANNKF